MKLIILAAVLLVVLVIFFAGILPIFTGKQIPFIKSQTEYTTQDCDNDGVIGLSDPCPCANSIKSKSELEKVNNRCPTPDSTTICPDLCKSATAKK